MDNNCSTIPTCAFNKPKAGLEQSDKDHVNQIIEEWGKTSEYFKRLEEKKAPIDIQINQHKETISASKKDEVYMNKMWSQYNTVMKSIFEENDRSRYWVHIDIDMFYVAVELRDRPELADKPVGVGNPGCFAASNYIARKYGVRSAMPLTLAKRLCPGIIMIPSNMEKYKEASKTFMDILLQYDSDLESMGLDEARLDLTDYFAQNDIRSDEEICQFLTNIKNEIFDSLKITVSCGVSCNMMLAKLCSEKNKPDGYFHLENDQSIVQNFLDVMTINKIPGIGPKYEY